MAPDTKPPCNKRTVHSHEYIFKVCINRRSWKGFAKGVYFIAYIYNAVNVQNVNYIETLTLLFAKVNAASVYSKVTHSRL